MGSQENRLLVASCGVLRGTERSTNGIVAGNVLAPLEGREREGWGYRLTADQGQDERGRIKVVGELGQAPDEGLGPGRDGDLVVDTVAHQFHSFGGAGRRRGP